MKQFEALATPKAMAEKSFVRSLKKTIRETDGDKHRLGLLCRHVLSAPPVVAHAKWPDLVKQVLALSKDYADVAEEAYGERMTMAEDDDGWLFDAWGDGMYVTVDLVLEHVLAQAAPAADKRWTKLALAALDTCERSEYLPAGPLRALLEAGADQKKIEEVLARAREIAARSDVEL